jgi:hypothetical protein
MLSNTTSTSPLFKRRKIDVPCQIDQDTVTGNEANGESDIDSELHELDGDSDLGEVEDMNPSDITQEQIKVLGLQSGNSWAEVEAKLGGYSGLSARTSKRHQEEEKETKKHARKFHKMTEYFPKCSDSSSKIPAPAPAPALAPAPRADALLLGEMEVPNSCVLAPELDTFECDYEASDSDDTLYQEAMCSQPRTYGQHQREKERQKAKVEKVDLYKSYSKTLQKMLEQKVIPRDHKVGKPGRKQEWESALQFRRATSLVIFYNLMIHSSKTRVEASKLAAVAQGKAQYHGGRSIRKWARVFEETKELPSSQRGAHGKVFSLLSLPEVAHAMRTYLRSNKWSMTPVLLAQYSAGTMAPETAKKYAQEIANREMPNGLSKYVTEEIFPRFGTKVQGGIKPCTARRWMLREGFRCMRHQKGVYVDGHERPDVAEYRQKVFIPAIRSYQPRIIEYEVGNCTQEVVKVPTNERPIAILFHDESTFQAHDAQEKSWVLDSQYQLWKKGVGRGIHRSDFIGPIRGWCKEAGVQIKYGKNHDGYWSGEDVCNQLKEKAIPALEKQHPNCQLLLIFDNSSGHASFASDALVASRMNLGPGGKNVKVMKNGWYLDKDGKKVPILIT